jgi:hypothetical protein
MRTSKLILPDLTVENVFPADGRRFTEEELAALVSPTRITLPVTGEETIDLEEPGNPVYHRDDFVVLADPNGFGEISAAAMVLAGPSETQQPICGTILLALKEQL